MKGKDNKRSLGNNKQSNEIWHLESLMIAETHLDTQGENSHNS